MPVEKILAMTVLLLPLLSGCSVQQPAQSFGFYQVETTKPYADVLAELEIAITEQNFRITGHNHIGSVIRSRENIEFPDYDTFQFCNLTLARQMLEMSPATVSFMPCNVAVRSEGGKVILTTHLLPVDSDNPALNAFFRGMNDKLKKILEFAAEK